MNPIHLMAPRRQTHAPIPAHKSKKTTAQDKRRAAKKRAHRRAKRLGHA